MYSFIFFIMWSVFFATLVVSPVFLALAIFSAPIWAGPTLVAVAISVWARLHHQRVNIRASLNPFGCCRPRPQTREALLKALDAPLATVVGSGWASYLNRRVYTACVFTDNFKKRIGDFTWEAGATIKEVQMALQKQGLTLSRFPSMEWVTLGGWVATLSHSHPGTDSQAPIQEATVYSTLTKNGPKKVSAEQFPALMEQEKRTNIVLDVTFRPIRDFVVERTARNMVGPAAVRWWFYGESTMRLMFAGARGILGLVWRKTSDVAAQTYDSGVFGQWWDIDIGAYLANRSIDGVARRMNEDPKRFQTHSRSIQTVPNLFPTYLLWPIILGICNFEVYVKPQMEGMYTFLENLVKFHKKYGGRSELRFDGTALAIDFAVRTPRRVFEFLRTNNYRRLALHIGKSIVDCAPCDRVRLANL